MKSKTFVSARHRCNGALLAVTLACVLASGKVMATEDGTRAITVNDILGALSTVPERRDCFVESRQSALLKEPLKSEGTLEFRSPSYLEKRTLTPELEYFVADKESVTIKNTKFPKARQLKLTSYPPLEALIIAFRATLAGDVAAMEKYFEASIQGTAAQWKLVLLPKAKLKKLLVRVEVAGTGATVREFTVHESGGDISTTEIVSCRPPA